MVEWTLAVLKEGLLGSLGIVKSLVIVIIPLMVVLQIMTDYKWLEKLSKKTKWLTDFLGVSKDSLIPLLIGVFAGVSYGAGAIVFAREKYGLSRDDIFLCMCFLVPFHGIIETTLIFWVVGVNPLITLSCRFCVALFGTLMLKQYVSKKKKIS
ncbi:MAG: nucleoside recognition protein [Clostridiales bacterium]|nr:nucleoside recognition protein [Clostridiales bacterium]